MKLPPLVAVIGVVAISLLALARPISVEAHARYESSSPAKGEILAVSPDEVEITFSQDIQRITGKYGIQVVKDRGPSVTAGPAVVDDANRTRMSVPLQPDLPDGRYVVNWNNVSDDDGDPLEGAFSFYVNYQPNTVDLANDEELALIGEEGTPATTDTASAVETPSSDQTPSGGESPSASATAESGGDDGGGSGNTTIALSILGVIVAAAVVAGGAFYFMRGRARKP